MNSLSFISKSYMAALKYFKFIGISLPSFVIVGCSPSLQTARSVSQDGVSVMRQIVDDYNSFVGYHPKHDLFFRTLPINIPIVTDPSANFNLPDKASASIFTYNEAVEYYKIHYPDKISDLTKSYNGAVEQCNQINQKKRDSVAKLDKMFQWAFFNNPKFNTLLNPGILFINNNFCLSSGKYVDPDCWYYAQAQGQLVFSGIEISVDSLLFSNNYYTKNPTISPQVARFMENSLENAKRLLDTEKFNQVKNYHINFTKLNNNELWVMTSLDGDSIYVSPKLVRAAFIFSYNKVKTSFEKFTSDDQRALNGMTTDDLNAVSNTFIGFFSLSLQFLLSHELAHVYLHNNKLDFNTEKLCDSNAIKVMQGYLKEDDIFNLMLVSTAKAHKSYLWGSLNDDQLLERAKIIDSLLNKIDNENLNKKF